MCAEHMRFLDIVEAIFLIYKRDNKRSFNEKLRAMLVASLGVVSHAHAPEELFVDHEYLRLKKIVTQSNTWI